MFLKRLFRLAALLALLLAPMGMLGGHAAMAMPQHGAPMAMSHCDEQQQQSDHQPRSMIDCAIACSALPSVDPFVPPRLLPVIVSFETAAPIEIKDTRSEAATPPPRPV